ncbi:MAG: hypothetical protein KC653_02115, partial [Candidatus Andersenbacteria bacterium]|nr:hypothetical protein [Candidatus Andersenbacteria bacterium]
MPLNDTQLKDVLLSQHYVGKDDIRHAERLAKERGAFLVDVLLAEGLITSDLVGQAFAESYGVPYADLNTHTPS